MSDLTKLIVTAALAFASGIAAAMVGAFYVHKLTRSRDHDIWVRDSRIKEWQELLDSLTKAYMLQLSTNNDYRAEAMMEFAAKQQDALADVDGTISTRIFVADDMDSLGIRTKWAALVNGYQLTQRTSISNLAAESQNLFKRQFQDLRKSIVEAAKKTK